jgi:F0F1-type ATP synthase epsilon subunit
MKRIAVFALLLVLHGGWLAPARAQSPGVAEYARRSREMDKKSARQQNRMLKKASKKQQKAMKKYAKAQRKAAKRANRRSR